MLADKQIKDIGRNNKSMIQDILPRAIIELEELDLRIRCHTYNIPCIFCEVKIIARGSIDCLRRADGTIHQ